MGLFDFLFDKDKAQAKQIEKLKTKLMDIWVQSADRNYAAEQLRDIGTPDAILALVERFKAQVKNSTYDNEEKLYVYDMLVALGSNKVTEVLQDYVRKEGIKINWPMKVLDDLMPSEQMAPFVAELLGALGIDYERDPEKKEQLILRAERFKDFEEVAQQVARFAEDDNESIRFVSVSQVVAQDADWAAEALRKNLLVEDSGRISKLTCARLMDQKWAALNDPEDAESRARIEANLPNEILLGEDGFLQRK